MAVLSRPTPGNLRSDRCTLKEANQEQFSLSTTVAKTEDEVRVNHDFTLILELQASHALGERGYECSR